MRTPLWIAVVSIAMNFALLFVVIAFVSQPRGPVTQNNAVVQDTCFGLVAKEFCVESRLVYPWELGGSDNKVMMALKVKKGATFFSPDNYLRASMGVGSTTFVCVVRDVSAPLFSTAFNMCISSVSGVAESSIPYNGFKVVTKGEPLLTVKSDLSRSGLGLPRIGPLDDYNVVVSFK